jgi:KDO2-lipid IV(A) lauroyltransferase
MQYIGYIITRSLVWLLHLLPERLLFLIADVFYFLVYHLVGYRRKVVYSNLKRAFPEKDQREIRNIARRFYHHLCDLILESAISHFYSKQKAHNRIRYLNPEVLEDLYGKGKMVMAVTAHYGNWEYYNTLSDVSSYPILAIYKPLKNKYIDNMVIRNRTQYGVGVTAMEKIARQLIDHYRKKDPVATIFLADQRPLFQNIQYWTKFLGQDTPLYLGTEKLARKLDAAVVFMKMRKSARGRYEVEFELITEDPSSMESFAITNAHVKVLEDLIREAPEYWLWSHKRWKHSYERYLEVKAKKSNPKDASPVP